jgi:hypothetical protein
MIKVMRVNGIFASVTEGNDTKLNAKFQKVTLMFEDGKKHAFKAFGITDGVEKISFGALVELDIHTPVCTVYGDMASRGDCLYNCSDIKIVKSASDPLPKGV